jgi:hypothetical protein
MGLGNSLKVNLNVTKNGDFLEKETVATPCKQGLCFYVVNIYLGSESLSTVGPACHFPILY